MGRSEQLELGLDAGGAPRPPASPRPGRGRRGAAEPVTVYVDGASKGNPGLAAIGVAVSRQGRTLKEIAQVIGQATNNEAEYTALITGLEAALKLGATQVRAVSDSQLLVRQVNGVYKAKNARIVPLLGRVRTLVSRLERFEIQHVDRSRNTRADQLANQAIKEHLSQAKHKEPKQTG